VAAPSARGSAWGLGAPRLLRGRGRAPGAAAADGGCTSAGEAPAAGAGGGRGARLEKMLSECASGKGVGTCAPARGRAVCGTMRAVRAPLALVGASNVSASAGAAASREAAKCVWAAAHPACMAEHAPGAPPLPSPEPPQRAPAGRGSAGMGVPARGARWRSPRLLLRGAHADLNLHPRGQAVAQASSYNW